MLRPRQESPIGGKIAYLRGEAMTLDVGTLSPAVALIAGILILLMPRLLNYVIAIYLIVIGLLGLMHHVQ
jgi:hypothetical protein